MGSWVLNFNQLWFNFSPTENLGSPPKQAEKIVYIDPLLDYTINKYRAYVFVQTKDNKIYRCCSWSDTHDWVQVNTPLKTPFLSEELACAKDTEKRWNISKRQNDITHSMSLGGCPRYLGLVKYSSYQINPDGTISGKIVEENPNAQTFTLIQLFFMRPVSIVLLIWFLFKTLVRQSAKSATADKIDHTTAHL